MTQMTWNPGVASTKSLAARGTQIHMTKNTLQDTKTHIRSLEAPWAKSPPAGCERVTMWHVLCRKKKITWGRMAYHHQHKSSPGSKEPMELTNTCASWRKQRASKEGSRLAGWSWHFELGEIHQIFGIGWVDICRYTSRILKKYWKWWVLHQLVVSENGGFKPQIRTMMIIHGKWGHPIFRQNLDNQVWDTLGRYRL